MHQKIAVIGLGYVGLPLAHAFSFHHSVVGFEVNQKRIAELQKGIDTTQELSHDQVNQALKNQMLVTDNIKQIKDCTIYIITVPTPIDAFKVPDLSPLFAASKTVGQVLKKGDIVIYESTVYPGATEEDCVPILEQYSNLIFNKDFFCGYSPERINPGDKAHTVTKIKKITSGSTPAIAQKIDALYRSVITAGTFLASSIQVAEAAKVIENTQRDINIAFINELFVLFDKMGIDIHEVLKAAGTKWNFLPFKPGLVGGHCIGVDPYYLTYKAKKMGHNPEMILAGRGINDAMAEYIAIKIIKQMIKHDVTIKGAKVLVLGVTFKANCPDIRNSKVFDVIKELQSFGCEIDVSDVLANSDEVEHEYGLSLVKHQDLDFKNYDYTFLAVPHHRYKKLSLDKYSFGLDY